MARFDGLLAAVDRSAELEVVRYAARPNGSRLVTSGMQKKAVSNASDMTVIPGSGTDVARESADVVLLDNDLVRFVETLRVARRVRRTIWQNFVGTLAVDALGIVLAACGLLGPFVERDW